MRRKDCWRGLNALALFCSLLIAIQPVQAQTTPPTTAPAHIEKILRAGAIQLKFADGELRYLRVGKAEIVRRIYFAVREAGFAATDMPVLSNLELSDQGDHFAIQFTADCAGKTISYHWQAHIIGSADGTITFGVQGSAPADGQSGRIGLCVLFGDEAMSGHQARLIKAKGDTQAVDFPTLITNQLIGADFHTLGYQIPGLDVSVGIPESTFDMEDQRHWGDSSFKAYAAMPYPYPKIDKGIVKTQTLTLSVRPTTPSSAPTTQPTTAPVDGLIHLKLGEPIAQARIPVISPASQFDTAVKFYYLNGHRQQFANETAITWNYTTATHLPDWDTAFENVSALRAQAATVRSFAPRALLRVGPMTTEGRWANLERPDNFKAAWTIAAIHALALAHIDEAAFADNSSATEKVIEAFKRSTGKPVLAMTVTPDDDSVDAFAINDLDTTTLWIVHHGSESKTLYADDLLPELKPLLDRPESGNLPTLLTTRRLVLSPMDAVRIVLHTDAR